MHDLDRPAHLNARCLVTVLLDASRNARSQIAELGLTGVLRARLAYRHWLDLSYL